MPTSPSLLSDAQMRCLSPHFPLSPASRGWMTGVCSACRSLNLI
jgi:hypothetical protein